MNPSGRHPIPESDETADRHTGPEQVSVSLIGDPSLSHQQSIDNGYSYREDNPYRDTTESDINLRHIPLGDLVPRPWKTFEQVMVASYVSCVLFLISGVFAVKFARRGKRRQSKGLMGMAQRDLQYAVWCIYTSLCLGILLWLIIVPIAASA